MRILASLLAAGAVAGVVWIVVDPPRSMRVRVQPYLARNRAYELWMVRTGRRADPRTVVGWMVALAAERVGDVIDGLSREGLLRRLRQARMFQDSEDPAAAYRLRQLGSVAVTTSAAGLAGVMVGMPPSTIAAMTGLGLVVGGTRQRGRLDRAIQQRCSVMAIEIYTVNQVLAMRVRAGGGVIQAITHLAARAQGEVATELREALRMHRAGLPASEAFRRIADETPEPACARTYGFLALAEERGTDLADALLSLAEDVREARREAIRRTAVRRRAAMLVPTIAVLAPVMLLFVGAPLPSLVLGFG